MPVCVEYIPSFVLKINSLNSRERKDWWFDLAGGASLFIIGSRSATMLDNIMARFRKQWGEKQAISRHSAQHS
jgi:hypothetical protein